MKSGTKIGIFCVVGAGVVVCAVLFFFGGSDSPPPDANGATVQQTRRADDATSRQAVEYLVSEKFVEMDKDSKQEYLEQINQTYTETPVLTLLLNSSLSEQQRRQLMANIVHK